MGAPSSRSASTTEWPPDVGAKLTLKGAWNSLLDFLDPTHLQARLRVELKRKMAQQVQLLRADVIRYIDQERHGIPNSPLTILVKGSSRPLVDRGDLRQSISASVEVYGANVRGAVGVMRSARGKGGKGLVSVAAALHEGFTIKVTPKVRAAVFAEMRKRRGKVGKGKKRRGATIDTSGLSGAGARVWHVRGRPFIRQPLDEATQRIVMALGDGVSLTLKK